MNWSALSSKLLRMTHDRYTQNPIPPNSPPSLLSLPLRDTSPSTQPSHAFYVSSSHHHPPSPNPSTRPVTRLLNKHYPSFHPIPHRIQYRPSPLRSATATPSSFPYRPSFPPICPHCACTSTPSPLSPSVYTPSTLRIHQPSYNFHPHDHCTEVVRPYQAPGRAIFKR